MQWAGGYQPPIQLFSCKHFAANLQELAAVLLKFSGEIVKFSVQQEGYILAAILLKYSGDIVEN